MTTMTRYRDDFDTPVRLPRAGAVRASWRRCSREHGVRQLHVAETEKYAHVTYFFNGGREEECPGEERILVPSPRDVPSYDHKPEMSAREVTDRFVEAIESGEFGFAVSQLCEPGHGRTHRFYPRSDQRRSRPSTLAWAGWSKPSASRAAWRSSPPTTGMPSTCSSPTGKPHTAHTSNPVPFVLTDTNVSLSEGGELSDLAPTALALLGLEPSLQMTGKNLTDLPRIAGI